MDSHVPHCQLLRGNFLINIAICTAYIIRLIDLPRNYPESLFVRFRTNRSLDGRSWALHFRCSACREHLDNHG